MRKLKIGAALSVLIIPLCSCSNQADTSPPITEASKPVEIITPAPTSYVPPPVTPPQPDDPCLFGAVYYSYYSASERETHRGIQFGKIIPEDSLSRQGQEQMLYSLSKDCGPVGANIMIEEKKITHARNRSDAQYKMRELEAQQIINDPKYK